MGGWEGGGDQVGGCERPLESGWVDLRGWGWVESLVWTWDSNGQLGEGGGGVFRGLVLGQWGACRGGEGGGEGMGYEFLGGGGRRGLRGGRGGSLHLPSLVALGSPAERWADSSRREVGVVPEGTPQ